MCLTNLKCIVWFFKIKKINTLKYHIRLQKIYKLLYNSNEKWVVMKKIGLVLLIVMLLCPKIVDAQRGCCSHHGGVVGCSSSGKQICADGTLSPSCTCTPPTMYRL